MDNSHNSQMKSLTTGMGAVLATVFFAVVSLSTLVATPEAHATGGQCKWEGGQGAAGGFAYCAAEDCVGNGGLAQCTDGVGAPPSGYTDAQVAPDKWVYATCDEEPPYAVSAMLWCQAAGGTWTVSGGSGQCTGVPSPMLGATVTSSESAAVGVSDTWIGLKFAGCSTSLASDSGWGSMSGPYYCWSGSPTESFDVQISGYKRRTYNIGGACQSTTFDIILREDRGAKCPPGYKNRTATTGPECYLPSECEPCVASKAVSELTGTKFNREEDYAPAGNTGLNLTRYYKSTGDYRPGDLTGLPSGSLSNTDYWRHSYDRRLFPISGNSQVSGMLQVPNGGVRVFNTTGNEITRNNGTNGTGGKLQAAGGGWDLTLANADVEHYNSSGRLTTITTRAGQVTTLAYTGTQLTTVTGPFGHTLHFAYNSDGLLATVTLPDDGVIAYGYDSFKRLTSVTYPDLTSKQYHYESTANRFLLTGITDETGTRYATYTYDTAGRVTNETLAGGAESRTYAYGASLGQPTTVTDPLGTATQYGFAAAGGMYRAASYSQPCMDCGRGTTTYDANGNPATTTDFNGHQTVYTYDTTRNLETSRTEANGTPRARTIATTWHSTFRLPTQITEPGRTTAYSYDGGGNVLTETITDTATSASRTWTMTYDGLGRVLTIDGPRSDVADTTTFSYYTCTAGGQCGQVQTVTDAAGQETTFSSYDDNGMPLTITDANGTITTLSYDDRQRVTSRTTDGETTAFEYWPTGLLKKVTLPDSSFVAYEYDAAQRLKKITDTDGNSIVYTLDAAGHRTAEQVFDAAQTLVLAKTRTYDNLGHLASEEGSADQTTSYSYDGDGNLLATTDPMGRITSQAYDELDRLKSLTDAASGLTQLGYDGLDHLLSVIDPRSLTTSYGYNAFGDNVSLTSPDTGASAFTHDATGNVDVATDARSESADYAYDALGRVTEIEYGDQTVEMHYDQGTNGAGHLTSIVDASGTTVWTYDARGRVLTRTQTTDTVTLAVGYDHDALGHLATLTTPSGQVIGYSYTSGRVTGLIVNGQTLLEGIAYEPFGPTAGWEWGNGATTLRQYDADGQLTHVSSAGSSTYTYFPDGLIKSRNDDFTASIPITAGSTTFTLASTSNRLQSASGLLTRTYGYDAAGNTLSDAAKSFTYDDAGRMAMSTSGGVTTTYAYNGLGERVMKTNASGTVYFAYDEAGHLLGEYDEEGELIQETVWFQDMPVATLRPDGASGIKVYYVHTDHLNTPRRVTDPSDNEIVWRWDSEPYGATPANQDPDGDTELFTYNLRFPGQYFDDETALHYNYYRDYDAVTGRYVESDPLGLQGGIASYAYVASDPVGSIDPLGLDWIEYRGQTLALYAGEPGDRARRLRYCGATSGLRGYQEPRYQHRKDEGPVQEGWYTVDLRPDPWRTATVGSGGDLNADVGIQRIPRTSHGVVLTNIPNAWGSWRARLQPDKPTDRENFYLHNSHKLQTHGCIETCDDLFDDLVRYRKVADFIRVHVDYSGVSSTLGPSGRQQ